MWGLCRVTLASLLFSALFFPIVLGQDFRATVTGQVTDPAKASVPNANVKATNFGNNEVTETKTNADGYYSLPLLNPGEYAIEVSAQGFKTVKRAGITLRVADKLELPIVLEVGQMNQEVTVTAQQEILNTTSADRGLSFDPIKTQEYPLNGRQVYMLLALTPGVIFTQEQFGANGFSGTRGWDTNGSYRINGGRSGTNMFLMNGAPLSDYGSWQFSPNVEAVQEFKVQTSNYDAQYGRTGGGTVNTLLKSGSNAWHGDVFDYWRNSIMDANTTQNNLVGASKGKHNQHQFGGVVGGPIRKDKDFVFFSDEEWREVVPFPLVQNTPPLDIRDGQHFTQYNINVYDPLTTHACGAADNCPGSVSYVRDRFPGNVIPLSRISPIGAKILSLYPAPNSNVGQLQQNFFATGSVGRYGYDQPIGRWDHVFGPNDKFYALFSFQHGHEFRNNNGFPPPAQRGNITSERQFQGYITDYTHVFTPTSILDLRASFTRFTSFFPDGSDSFGFTYDQLGIKNMPIPPTVNRKTAPHIALDQYPEIIGTSYSWNTDNQIDIEPSITQTHGKQTWHYGGEYANIGRGAGGPGQATGRLNFDSKFWTQHYKDQNFSGSGATDGFGLASLLLGLPNSGNIDYNDSYYRRNNYLAFFFQDDWKIHPRLALNLGLRYDVQYPFTEIHNRVNAGFDFSAKNPYSDQIIANWTQLKAQWDAANPAQTDIYPAPPSAILGGLLFAGKNGTGSKVYNTDYTNIQPRIGMAFSLTHNTVLRGGFGIYHRAPSNSQVTYGFSQSTNYIRSTNGDITPAAGLTGPYSLENPFPNGYIAPPGSSAGLLTNIGNGISVDSNNLPIPRTYEFSFGIQQQLPWSLVLEAAYAGNQTYHEPVNIQTDYLSAADFASAAVNPSKYNQNVPNPFFGILPNTSSFGSGSLISSANLRRPYPEFNGVEIYTNPIGKYRYDALQMSLEKKVYGSRSAGMVTFVFSYTFSKSYEQNHFLSTQNPGINNIPLQGNLIKELDYQDKPQTVAFSGVWDLPIGRGTHLLNTNNRLVDGAFGGWSFDWIYTYSSGYPTGVPNALFTCASYTVQNQTANQYFNNDKSCYHDYTSYSLRSVPDRFAWIRDPFKPQLNIALQKTFKFSERYSLRFRAESFNVTNTPILQGPNTDRTNSRFGMLPLQQNNFPRLVQLAAKFYF
ncbi:MAG: hypothetical protein JWO80_3362 [Bryobacterales bacterium]|nr:hypothetical protein [Bryobacterales bacterium]